MRDLYIRRMSLPEPLPRESYLNELPVVKHLAKEGIDFHRQVTFFVGENGSGKSTLIEALAVSQWRGDSCIPGTGSSSGRKASTTSRPILTRWTGRADAALR